MPKFMVLGFFYLNALEFQLPSLLFSIVASLMAHRQFSEHIFSSKLPFRTLILYSKYMFSCLTNQCPPLFRDYVGGQKRFPSEA